MNGAVINVRVSPDLKSAAQATVRKMGLDLSSVINMYLKELVRAKGLLFTPDGAYPIYYASEALEKKSKKALKEIDKAIEITNIHEFFKNL